MEDKYTKFPGESGISLIEALIALIILAMSVTALMKLTQSTSEANRMARRITSALHLAQDKFEDLRGLAHSAVVSGTDGPLTQERQTNGPGAFYTRTWTVTDDSPVAGVKNVVVTVSWTEKDRARTSTFHSLFTE